MYETFEDVFKRKKEHVRRTRRGHSILQSAIRPVGVCGDRYRHLYLVTLDSIGATIGMSPFLNTFLDERLDRRAFPALEIRPLFCSDIEALETMTGFLGSIGLPGILERWFETNPSLATPLLAVDFDSVLWRENPWLHTEWKAIFKTMTRILFPDRDPDVALAEVSTFQGMHKFGFGVLKSDGSSFDLYRKKGDLRLKCSIQRHGATCGT